MTDDFSGKMAHAGQVPYRLALKTAVAGQAASKADTATVLKLCLEVLLINPDFIPANELMATSRIIDGDLEMAVMEFDNILRTDPGSSFGNFGKTIMMCLTGKHQESLNGLLELTEDPELEEVGHFLLSRLLGLSRESYFHGSMFSKLSQAIKEGKTKTAHDLLGEISSTVENPRLQIVLSDILVARGERKTAKRILEQLSDSHPNYPDMLYRLAQLELSDQNKSRSQEFLSQLYDTDPLYPDGAGLLGNSFPNYTLAEDRQGLVSLRAWCFEVIRRICLAQKPKEQEPAVIAEFQPEMPRQTGTNQPEPESETVSEPEQIFRLPTTEAPLSGKKDAPQIYADDEPDKATEEIQLFRTRKILEEAKKILDSTRIDIDLQKEIQKQLDLQAEAETELQKQRDLAEMEEEAYDGPTLFDEPKPAGIEPIALAPSVEEVLQEPDYGCVPEETAIDESPKRIVLPTSDEAPQITPERAWQLLRAGEAEEAFMMFSKLIRGDR